MDMSCQLIGIEKRTQIDQEMVILYSVAGGQVLKAFSG